MGPPPPRLERGHTSARAHGRRALYLGPCAANTDPTLLSETSRRRGQQWGQWWRQVILKSQASSDSSFDTALPTERGGRKGRHSLQNHVWLVSSPSFWLYPHTRYLCHRLPQHNCCHQLLGSSWLPWPPSSLPIGFMKHLLGIHHHLRTAGEVQGSAFSSTQPTSPHIPLYQTTRTQSFYGSLSLPDTVLWRYTQLLHWEVKLLAPVTPARKERIEGPRKALLPPLSLQTRRNSSLEVLSWTKKLIQVFP